MSAAEFYLSNRSNSDVLTALENQYTMSTSDWEKTFLVAEIALEAKSSGDEDGETISAGCALALAGQVVSTMGALTIATGWGFAVWAAGQAISLASVAVGC